MQKINRFDVPEKPELDNTPTLIPNSDVVVTFHLTLIITIALQSSKIITLNGQVLSDLVF